TRAAAPSSRASSESSAPACLARRQTVCPYVLNQSKGGSHALLNPISGAGPFGPGPLLIVHNPAVPQMNDPRTVRRDPIGVRHLDNRRSGAIQLAEQLHDFLAVL